MKLSALTQEGFGTYRYLDETFDLAFEAEQTTAACKPQTNIFLDCSKCYERTPLHKLEKFALESSYPLYPLHAALDMYAGGRPVLIHGDVSHPVTATHGMPPGCEPSVDLLHALPPACPANHDACSCTRATSAEQGAHCQVPFLHRSEVGGMSASHMKDVHSGA
eukprot:2381502-Amphidinium_carterae.1